jgi:hypothetical protein
MSTTTLDDLHALEHQYEGAHQLVMSISPQLGDSARRAAEARLALMNSCRVEARRQWIAESQGEQL